MASLVCLLVMALSSFSGAWGTLYPIKPISSTVLSAGMPVQVKWTEDGRKPFLNGTGKVQIDLYAGKSTYLATVAKGIDPMAGSSTIYIPSYVPGNYHAFVLRFITTEPPQTIYTADFAIIPNPASISVKAAPTRSAVAAVTVTSTLISRVTAGGTPSTAAAAARKTTTTTGVVENAGRRAARNDPGGDHLFTVDTEKMKFRIVFIVWPTLVGLSMAL